MVLETHGDTEDVVWTAELLAALLDIGKLPYFADEVEERGLAWHAICRLEDDCLAFERRNRWCGATDGWLTVVGFAKQREGTPPHASIDCVPKYVGWGPVQAWLRYGDIVVTVEPGYGLHIYDPECFEELFEASEIIAVPFADDSSMTMNHAFRLSPEDEKLLLGGHLD